MVALTFVWLVRTRRRRVLRAKFALAHARNVDAWTPAVEELPGSAPFFERRPPGIVRPSFTGGPRDAS